MMPLPSGLSWRISRQASTPLPSGRRTSMMTTSGCSRCVSLTAAATLPASPTTLMPGRRFRRERKPSRTTSWSSTIRTRRTLSVMAASLSAYRDFHHHLGASAQHAGHGQATAEGLHPLVHIPHTSLSRRCRQARVKADTVVPNGKPQDTVAAGQAHLDAGGPGVLLNVGQGLLGD